MPGLVEAAVGEGFVGLAGHVDAVPETDDAVADHLVKGWSYADWALARPALYRAMFGVTDPSLRHRAPVEATLAAAHLAVGDGRTALDVLVRSVQRMIDAGRLRPAEAPAVARQFLSATHGYVLLEIGGAFGAPGGGLATMAELALNLLVGLGDSREAAERSLLAAAVAPGPVGDGGVRGPARRHHCATAISSRPSRRRRRDPHRRANAVTLRGGRSRRARARTAGCRSPSRRAGSRRR